MVTIKGHEAETALIAAILIAGTVIIGTGQISLADTVNRGIDIPTNTNQNQVCKTNGNNSPESGSCTAGSSNTISQSGGDTMAPTEQGVTSTSSPITEFLTFVVSGGDCLTNNGVHLTCVILPQPGLFPWL